MSNLADAAKSLSIGFCVLAREMNQILEPHGLMIPADDPGHGNPGELLHEAIDNLRRCDLRPSDFKDSKFAGKNDRGICPWSFGFLNSRSNREILFSIQENTVEDAVFWLKVMSEKNWTQEQWKDLVVDPVIAWNQKWTEELAIAPKGKLFADGVYPDSLMFVWGGRQFSNLTPKMISVLGVMFKYGAPIRKSVIEDEAGCSFDGGLKKAFVRTANGERILDPVWAIVETSHTTAALCSTSEVDERVNGLILSEKRKNS